MSEFATIAVHGGTSNSDAHGALRPPIYDSVAFEHPDARSMQLTFEGRKPAHAYSRITNPTVSDFEQRISTLCGGGFVLAVSSGMAAISNTILALAGADTNIVTSRNLFGNTLSLFQKTLAPWGLETRCVDMTDLGAVATAIDGKTRAVFLETMTNPQLEVADCKAIAGICRDKNVPLIMDNTVMTPYLFDCKEAGVAIEVLSSTKYISGGATTLGGLIIDHGNFDWSNAPRLVERAEKFGRMALLSSLRQEVYRNLGACMAPNTAYLHTLGLETLKMRIEKSCGNAAEIAHFLNDHPRVRDVHYPGLESSQFHVLSNRQFKGRYGGILTFELDSQETCFALIDGLQLIRRATNINDNKSLIIHPASTIFAEYSAGEKEEMAIRPTTIRLSVGIEECDDIIADLADGLDALPPMRTGTSSAARQQQYA